MQSIECHYNVYNFARRAVCSACGMFKALIGGRSLTYKDGNGMNALIRWPNSWCSVFVETRSISGLSPYNNRKTAERRASCEPRLQFIRPGVAVARTSIHFIQKRRTPPTVTFVPGIPSALYYWLFLFYRGLNSFFFSSFSLPLQGFSPRVHYGNAYMDVSEVQTNL
jgi:hypothetical protein